MKPIVVLDGGMSRELTRLGAELRQPEWSATALIESPDIVGRVHDEFVAAGADVITTNSYALVPFHIGEERFRCDGAALITLSGVLARRSADADPKRGVRVAGSLPPIFGSYEPSLFDKSRVHDYLAVLVDNLNPHIDVWLGETLSLIAEAEAVREAVSATGKPFWIAFTLQDDRAAIGGDVEPRLRSGESVSAAAEWAAGSGTAALLFNCSRPEVMVKAVQVASDALRQKKAQVQIGVYANAFEGDQDGGANETLHGIRQDLTNTRYCQFAREWVQAGATIIGGCCGIGACHIAEIVSVFGQPSTGS